MKVIPLHPPDATPAEVLDATKDCLNDGDHVVTVIMSHDEKRGRDGDVAYSTEIDVRSDCDMAQTLMALQFAMQFVMGQRM